MAIMAMLLQRLNLFRNGLAIVVLLAVPAMSNASELKQETLNAWDDYLQRANLRMHRNLGTGDPFLWIEEEPGRSQRVRQGEILISPAREASLQKVHDGLIHDWIGAVFIPCVATRISTSQRSSNQNSWDGPARNTSSLCSG